MSKTNKELAVELVLAQIQAASVIKLNNTQTGSTLSGGIVNGLINSYYRTLEALDEPTKE